jgi:hypothetical protein
MMKKALLAGIAALFLATGTAHAQDTENLPTAEENKTGIRKAAEEAEILCSTRALPGPDPTATPTRIPYGR